VQSLKNSSLIENAIRAIRIDRSIMEYIYTSMQRWNLKMTPHSRGFSTKGGKIVKVDGRNKSRKALRARRGCEGNKKELSSSGWLQPPLYRAAPADVLSPRSLSSIRVLYNAVICFYIYSFLENPSPSYCKISSRKQKKWPTISWAGVRSNSHGMNCKVFKAFTIFYNSLKSKIIKLYIKEFISQNDIVI